MTMIGMTILSTKIQTTKPAPSGFLFTYTKANHEHIWTCNQLDIDSAADGDWVYSEDVR